MKQALSLISRIREGGNNYIISLLKENGFSELSPSHGDILSVLYACEKITMVNMSKKIRRTKATVSVLVDKLEKLGLVKREKSTEDSRNVFISLTKKAYNLKPVFVDIGNKLNEKIYKDFSKEEALMLDILLEKMLKNL